MLGLAMLAGLLLGLSRGAHDITTRSGYLPLIGQTVSLRGVVYEDVDQQGRTNAQAS